MSVWVREQLQSAKHTYNEPGRDVTWTVINPRRMREGYGTCSVINPRRMREGYGTCSVIRSFVHSFCPPSCRDHRSLLKLGKGMNRLSTTMACNLTRGFC